MHATRGNLRIISYNPIYEVHAICILGIEYPRGEPERLGHTRHFLVQQRAASFQRCLLRDSGRHRVMRHGFFSLFQGTVMGAERGAAGATVTAVTLTSRGARQVLQK